jgi:phosphoribosylformylglycinamidine cyclo-ligase
MRASMADYVVCGALRPERVAVIVGGVAEDCVRAGCALIGPPVNG